MGSYVLYVLMQAMGALVFAYLGGVMAFRDRRPPRLLFAAGMYIIMGATLVAIWGDRGGWNAGGLGLFVALVSTGVACIGSASLFREAEHQDGGPDLELVGKALVGVTAILGIALAATGGSSDLVVDSGEVAGTEISGGFSNLGPVGWLLGVPLVLGAVAVVFSGARMSLTRGDGRGLWLWGSGIFLALWPLDPWLRNLPLTPTLLLLGLAMAYFGFQVPEEEEEEGKAEEQSQQTGLEDWLARSTAIEEAGGGEGPTEPDGVVGDEDPRTTED